jgi:anti-anti-sigma factor
MSVPITTIGDDTTSVSAGVFIHDDTHPCAAIVHVFGEVTFADTAPFESMLVSVVRIGRPVVVDLRECTYIDCAALGVMVRAAKNLGDLFRVIVLRPSQNNRMFEVTGLAKVLHIFEKTEEAVVRI